MVEHVGLEVSAPCTALPPLRGTIEHQGSLADFIWFRTGGSTFKNPQGHSAWKLVDDAGCRGLRRGDAQVSEKHCNFLLNLGNASSADIEALGEEVRAKVKAQSGVELEWEIQRIGIDK